MQDENSSATLIQVRVDIGVLQGTINTLLTEHGRRIQENTTTSEKLRSDLTIINERLTKEVTANTENIKNVRADVTEVQEKQNGISGKLMQFGGLVVAALALAYSIFNK